MIDAAQNVLDSKHHKSARSLKPSRIQRNLPALRGNHESARTAIQRLITHRQFQQILQLGRDRRLNRKNGIRRSDGIDKMRIEISLIKVNRQIFFERLTHMRQRLLIVLKRPVRRQIEAAHRAGRNESHSVLPYIDSLSDTAQRQVYPGPRGRKVVDLSLHGEVNRVQDVERHANYQMRLVSLHLDEGIHHRVQRNIMRVCRGRKKHGRKRKKECCRKGQNSETH